jgi:phospholipid/cholesterol/gamma-HCH transport system ATP-binding protein
MNQIADLIRKQAFLIDKLIQDLTTEFNTITIINTHDMNSVMEIGDNILYMYQGYKEWEGNPSKDIIYSKNERLNEFIFRLRIFAGCQANADD